MALEWYLKIRFFFLKAASVVRLVFLLVYLNGTILICKDTDTFVGGSLHHTNVLHGNDLPVTFRCSALQKPTVY